MLHRCKKCICGTLGKNAFCRILKRWFINWISGQNVQKLQVSLRLLDTYASKIARICTFWAFRLVKHVKHLPNPRLNSGYIRLDFLQSMEHWAKNAFLRILKRWFINWISGQNVQKWQASLKHVKHLPTPRLKSGYIRLDFLQYVQEQSLFYDRGQHK